MVSDKPKSAKHPRLAGAAAYTNHFFDSLPSGARVIVAYSGGLDSHVLLHASAAALARRQDVTLEAIHVNHNLQSEANQWSRHCELIAKDLEIHLHLRAVNVDEPFERLRQEKGLEAAARQARYAAFADVVKSGDFLLLAQHADDQAETFLLQALRGSGPDGLASIPARRRFAAGQLVRPLLGCTRAELEKYAKRHSLDHVVDPSNEDAAFDRNFLRSEILPLLAKRWPAANRTLSRSASRCEAASKLLIRQAADDFAAVRYLDEQELDITRLQALTVERRYNVLRYWVRARGFNLPTLRMLQQLEQDLLAGAGTTGTVGCHQYEFRRHRNRLYLMTPLLPAPEAVSRIWPQGDEELEMPELGCVLHRGDLLGQGITLPPNALIEVRNRKGGELLAMGKPVMHKSVKKLLQEADVPGWQRACIPLVYVDGELAAVWNIAVGVRFQQSDSADVRVARSESQVAESGQPQGVAEIPI